MIAQLARLAGETVAACATYREAGGGTYSLGQVRGFIAASQKLRAALVLAERTAAEDLPEGDAMRDEAGR